MWKRRALGLIPVSLAALVFFPILDLSFRRDDFLHFFQIANDGALQFVLQPHGGHAYLTRNLVFLVWHQIFGLHAEAYMALSLGTHLLNVFLVFRILETRTESRRLETRTESRRLETRTESRRLETRTESRRLALFGASLWGICPLNFGALSWFSAHGQVLATTFMLWALLDASRLVARQREFSNALALRWAAQLTAAATCFGMGVGSALAFVPVLWLLLGDHPARRRTVAATAPLLVAIPLLYAAQIVLFEAVYGIRVPDSDLLTQLRPADLFAMLARLAELASYGVAGLFGGPFLMVWSEPLGPLASGDYSSARAVAWVVAALVALFGCFGWWFSERRHAASALLLLGLSPYAALAVGRLVLLGSSPIAPMTPRYHYMALALLTLALCQLVPGRLLQSSRIAVAAIPAAWLALLLVAQLAAGPQPVPDARRAFFGVQQRVLAAVRAAEPGATVFVPNRAFEHVVTIDRGSFPGYAAVFVVAFPENRVEGREVRFVEKDPEVLAAARAKTGTRIAQLLVAPGEVARSARDR